MSNNAAISAKANLSDIKRTMTEVAANIESRVTYEDQRRMLDEKVNKTEIGYHL